MTLRTRGWIPVLVFWILFAASIGVGRRYPWLDTVWYIAGMLLLVALSICSLVYALRHRDEAGSVGFKMIPRWLERSLMGEDHAGTPPSAPKPH